MPYYINPVTGTVEKITKAQKGALDEHRRAAALNSLLASDFGVASVTLPLLLIAAPLVTAWIAKELGEEAAGKFSDWIGKQKERFSVDIDLSKSLVP